MTMTDTAPAIVPNFGDEDEVDRKLVIICSKGNLDMAYPGLILANAALGEGIETHLFFTFWGLDMILKSRMNDLQFTPVGNTAMHMPVGDSRIPQFLTAFPGMQGMSTKMMKKQIADLDEIWKAEKAQALGSKDVMEEIDRVRSQIKTFTDKGDLTKVAELQYGRLPELEKRLKDAQAHESGKKGGSRPQLLRTQVGAEEIAEVVARATGIPVAKLMQGERDKLLVMEDKLHSRVVGQDEAISAVANAIRRSRSGLSDPNRPTGSFLFLGPTGVGKTELCKALAGFLFDSEDHLVRIDMSEFMEKHSVARLIGAPPGYVGYEEGGYLTEAVRRKPYSVLLLDEVEKAHPDVFNVLLQVLDDGRLTDGQGRTVDFKNTVIVMTSNIGSHLIQAMVGQPYDDIKEAVWGELKDHFRPEFLNRIDETVVFHALDAQHIASIAAIQLKALQARLQKMDLRLEVAPAALEELAKVGFDPVFGARPLKRAIQQRIENPLSKLLLEGKYPPKSVIPVGVDPVRHPGVFEFGEPIEMD